MSCNFKLDRTLHEPDRVQILKLYFSPELFFAHTPNRNVRFATQVALLHVRLRRAHPLQRTSNVIDVVIGLPRRTKIRLRHDFSKWHTRTVEIDIRITIDVRQSFVHVLAGVFFEMQACDPDLFRTPFDRMPRFVALGSHDLELAVRGERLIVLRDLVTLRQVRVEIILTRKDRLVIDLQTKRERGTRAELYDASIQDGQCARQAKTGWTRV